MASRIIAKLSVLSKCRMPSSEMLVYLNWVNEQFSRTNDQSCKYLHSVAECVQLVMRIDDYRILFVQVGGINILVSRLLGDCGFQMQYQIIFSLWLLSFNVEIAGKIGEESVIPVLSDILRNSQKEKVTRIIIATFRNLLEKPEDRKIACVSLIQSKLLPIFEVMSTKAWGDEDIKDDIEYIQEVLNESL